MMRRYLLLLLFPVVVLGAPRFIRHDLGIPNQYMVILREETPLAAVPGIVESLEASFGVRSVVTWQYSIKGFLAVATEQQANAMLQDPRVSYVEQNFPGSGMTSGVENTWYGNEYLWHLDRLDDLKYGPPWPGDPDGRDSTYNKCPLGSSVYAYVIDFGVWNGHEELLSRDENGNVANRLKLQLDFSADQTNQQQNDPPDQTNACATLNPTRAWHGTAVASLVAGSTVGAAETNVISLKIAQCNTDPDYPGFSAASFVSALNWINDPTRNQFRSYPGVINFSGFFLPYDETQTLLDALTNTISQTQFPFFTSADNFSTNSCVFFPNNLAYTNKAKGSDRIVFSVGATSTGTTAGDPYDYRYQNGYTFGLNSGSNAGACVSAYAPGASIYAARNTGALSYERDSGTSFSSALAAGLAARYIEKQISQTGVRPTHTAVYDFLLNQGQVSPQWEWTYPTYWMCVTPDSITLNPGFTYKTDSSGCGSIAYGPYEMSQVGNSSEAKMLYWPSTCP